MSSLNEHVKTFCDGKIETIGAKLQECVKGEQYEIAAILQTHISLYEEIKWVVDTHEAVQSLKELDNLS